MKSTNVNPNNGQNGKVETKGAGFSIKPGVPVPVADLIREAKEKHPDAITDPTVYPSQAPAEPQTASTPTQEAKPEPQPAPEAPKPEPAQTTALIKLRSRSEEIEFQVEKSRKLQHVNTQLQSLKTKLEELKGFSYQVNQDDDHRYGRLVIYDDNNREFQCKNHGLAALVVEYLKGQFSAKIEEKETELLTVAQS